jgi:hypothetical protein
MAAKKPPSKGRISKLAANPGTRAALADKYLTPVQLKQRQLNQRLNAPVTAGSTLTNRDLAHQRQAATQVQYGPQDQEAAKQLGQAQQLQKDQGDWYAQYQAAANQLKTDLGNNAKAATDTTTGITNAVGQLGTATAVGDGNVASDAQKGSVIRQALSGAFGAMLASQGQSSKDYGAKIADLVVPGQKLTAMNQGAKNIGSVRDQIAALAREKGAFGTKFDADTIASEQKNALANQAFGLDVQKASTQAAQNSPAGKSAAAAATSEAQNASKYGYSVHDWRTLGPDGRQRVIKASKSKPADSVYSSGPFAGRKKSEVDAMSPGGRQTLVDRYTKKAGSGGKGQYLSADGQNTFKRSFDAARASAEKIKGHYSRNELRGLLKNGRSASTVYVDASGQPIDAYTFADAKKKDPAARPVPVPAIAPITDDAVLSAVLDTVLDGHLSQYTIAKLHKAHIKVNALGVSTKRPSTAQVVGQAISSTGQAVGGALSGR